MANSAYVIPKKFPAVTVIDAALRKIITNRFPDFLVKFATDGWIVTHRTLDYLSFNLWLSKIGRRRAIQIPHRHSYSFMWWVEYEIRERLAEVLGATQYDDGVGKVPNHSKFYATYSDYLRGVYPPDFLGGQVSMAKSELLGVSQDVLAMMGDLF